MRTRAESSEGNTYTITVRSCPQFTASAAIGFHSLAPSSGSTKLQLLGNLFEEYRCIKSTMQFMYALTNDGLADSTTPIGYAGIALLGYFPVVPAGTPGSFGDVLSAPYTALGLGKPGSPWPKITLTSRELSKGLRTWYATGGSSTSTPDTVQGIYYATNSAGIGFNLVGAFMIETSTWQFRNVRGATTLFRSPSRNADGDGDFESIPESKSNESETNPPDLRRLVLVKEPVRAGFVRAPLPSR